MTIDGIHTLLYQIGDLAIAVTGLFLLLKYLWRLVVNDTDDT